MPSGRTPHRYPEQLATPFLVTGKLQINMGTGVRLVQNSLFVPNFSKSGENEKFAFVALFGDFLASFLLFTFKDLFLP